MNTINFDDICKAIQSVYPVNKGSISLHEPCFSGKEWDYVKECIDSRWVSSVGTFVNRFEESLKQVIGCSSVVAVVNGTAALHISLKVLDVKPDDEVLVPTLTFVGTTNAIRHCNAIPHFVDSCEVSLNIDTDKLDCYLSNVAEIKADHCVNKFTHRKIAGLIAVHTYGHPVDLDKLVEICTKYKIALVEDAAEALGSYYKGRHVGNWGKLSTLSFNGNKIVTTGGGGAVVTNDTKLGDYIRHLTTTAKTPHRWAFNHDAIGYNYRLPNINAALGCAQLEQLPRFLEYKRDLARLYSKRFTEIKGVRFFTEVEYTRSNYWLNALLLHEPNLEVRDRLINHLHDKNIMVRPAWTLMHHLPMFKACPKMDLNGAEQLFGRIINLPSGVV